jgi:hypothetical protein
MSDARRRSVEGSTLPIRSRRRPLLGIGAVVLVGVAAAVVAIASGGGGSDSKAPAAGTSTSASIATPKPKPKPLSKAELIAKADAICEDSKSTYASVYSPGMEEAPEVAYAATLAGISQRGVNRFRALNAPASVEPAFGKYVEAQERVMRYDRQALKAAQEEDAEAYVAARERRDAEAEERYELAREVGLEQCSTNRR